MTECCGAIGSALVARVVSAGLACSHALKVYTRHGVSVLSEQHDAALMPRSSRLATLSPLSDAFRVL